MSDTFWCSLLRT